MPFAIDDATVEVHRQNHPLAVMTKQHYVNEGHEMDLVRDFGVVLNDTTPGARAYNKQAISDAFTRRGNYRLSIPGTVYLPADAQIVIPAGCGIWGMGMWEGQSVIMGDGDIFIIDNSTGGDSRTPLCNLTIANEEERGTLVDCPLTNGLGRTVFDRVNFKKSHHHVYQYPVSSEVSGYAVSWVFKDCYFESADQDSIYFSVFTTLEMFGCWHISNHRHLHLGDASINGSWSASFVSYSGVYGNSQEPAVLIASGADLNCATFFDPYFEANGQAGGPEILLQTVGSAKIAGVNIFGGLFTAPHANTTQHIDWIEGTADSIGKITAHGTTVWSSKPFAPNSGKFHNNNMTFIGSSPQSNWKTAQYV